MCRLYLPIVYVLATADFCGAMRSMRSFRVAVPQPQQLAALPAPADPAQNHAALVSVMQADPCWVVLNHPPDDEHAADVNCERAAAAFNSRNEALRIRCRYSVEPKCRKFGGRQIMVCSVKKLRPRSHLFCMLAGYKHEVVALSYCAGPIFNVQNQNQNNQIINQNNQGGQ